MDEIKDSDWLSKLEHQEYVLKAPKMYVEIILLRLISGILKRKYVRPRLFSKHQQQVERGAILQDIEFFSLRFEFYA